MKCVLLMTVLCCLSAGIVGQHAGELAVRLAQAGRLQFSDRDSSNLLARQVLKEAQAAGLDSIAIQAMMFLGNNANYGGDFETALIYFKQAHYYDPSYRVIPSMSIESAAKIAQVYLLRGQLDSARVYAERFDRLSDAYLDPNSVWPMILFGELYRTMERDSIADTYYLKAIKRSESTADTLSKTVSLFYYLSAHLEELSDPVFLPAFDRYLGLTARLRDDKTIEFVHAQMLFGEMPANEQIELLREASRRALEEGRNPLGYQLMLTDFLVNQRRLTDALEAANAGLAMTMARKDYGHLIDFHHRIAQIYAELGDYVQAYPHLEEYHALKDSIVDLEMNKNLDALNIQYETAKKENALLEQARQIGIRTSQRNMLLIGMTASILLGGFLIYFFWSKTRLTKRIAAQEKELDQHRIEQLESEKKLVAMTAMVEGQETERMRVARDLHDGLGGLLATVKSHYSTLIHRNTTPEAETVSHLIDNASREVRRISHNLAPQALRIGSLKEAISDLCTQARSNGIAVDFEWHGPDQRLPESTEIMLYRIAQELVHNVVKHARAKHLLIQVNRFEEEINLLAEDDGIGFDPDPGKTREGLGLDSLKSRVEFLNGTIDIDSQIGAGTTISVQIPLAT